MAQLRELFIPQSRRDEAKVRALVDRLKQLDQPAVFTEYVINGPARLHMAWLEALMGKR